MGVGLVGPWPLVVSQAVPLPSGPSGRGSLGPVRSRHGLPHGAGSTVRLQVGVVGWGPPELPPQGPRLLIAFLCPAVPPSCPAVASCLVGPWLGRSRVAHWPLSRPPAGLASPWPLLSLLSDPRGASFLPLLRSCHPSGSCRSPPPVWAPAAPQVPPAHVRGLCVQLATLHAVLAHGVCGGACGTAPTLWSSASREPRVALRPPQGLVRWGDARRATCFQTGLPR